jgi:Chaperone of endosialidase
MQKISFVKLSFLVLCTLFCYSFAQAQSVITYQGKLNDAGAPANGNYDFTFKLFSVTAGGSQIGADLLRDDVQVTNGVFTVNLDFGSSPFTSAMGNYLEILVRPGASTGAYTPLAPRLAINNSPYSMKSLTADNSTNATNATTATNALQLGGVAANQYVLTTDSRMTNARTPLPNSADYIWNTATQQSATFNVINGYIGGRLGVGTNVPAYKFELIDPLNTGLRVQTNGTGGTVASFGGNGAFQVDASGVPGGRFRIAENGNVGIGGTVFSDPIYKLAVSGTGIIRSVVNSDSNAGLGLFLNGSPKWSVATVTGSNFQIFNDTIGSNAFWIDSTSNNVGIGTTNTTAKLTVNGGSGRGLVVTTGNSGDFVAQFGSTGVFAIDNATVGGGRLRINENGNLRINNPPPAATIITGNTEMLTVNGYIRAFMPPLGIGIPVCQEAATSTLVLCAVSSRRYKKNIQDFNEGLSLISRLRPVSFNWKANDKEDFGLVAEEVAEVAPLLTYYNANGEVEGVKYDRIGVIAVNAIKEQQTQIEGQKKQLAEQDNLIKQQTEKLERQQSEIERQKTELEALKKLVCSTSPTAEICQPKK